MGAPTPTERYREMRSENLRLRRQVDELEMRLRLSNAREQKALERAKAAELNSRQWHALLLQDKISRVEVRNG